MSVKNFLCKDGSVEFFIRRDDDYEYIIVFGSEDEFRRFCNDVHAVSDGVAIPLGAHNRRNHARKDKV